MDRKILNVAIVGCGRIAREHVKAYKTLGECFRIVAFADLDISRASGFADEFEMGRAYDSVARACRNEDIHAVDLCLPPCAHCPAAVEAADLGRHVIVEKPLAVTCEQVDYMIDAAERNGVVVMSGQSRRFNGPLR